MALQIPFIEDVQNPNRLLTIWRAQRAYRVGRVLCYSGAVIAILATVTDIYWSPPIVVVADFILLLGCLFSLMLTRSTPEEPYFYWWPIYFGFWIKMWPSVLYTGGISSPLLGIFLSILYIAGVVIQARVRAVTVAIFAFLNIPAIYLFDLYLPLQQMAHPPEAFLAIMHVLGYVALIISAFALIRTENELSQEFSKHYIQLSEAKADLKKEEASNFAKTTFMANVSHELRTPLGAIVGYSEMLKANGNSQEETERFTEAIHRNSQQLARLVDDLLDLSKVEAGTVEIEKASLKLNDLLNDVLDLSSPRADKKKIPIFVQYRNPVPETIYSDFTRVRQILLNLVNNAIKFTARGQIKLSVKHLPGEDGGKVEIVVTDTGRGILDEEKSRLFKPFSQGDPSLARKYGGTGLGLNLSRKLAMLLGGSLELTSTEVHQGSTFTLKVPVGTSHSQPFVSKFKRGNIETDGPEIIETQSLKGKKILVVDDTIDNLQLIKTFLASTGARVDTASDGFRGIEMAFEKDYDVILMDIQMPQMDGYEAVAHLRKAKYRRPILALTAHAMREDIERSLAAGFDGHLTKPITKANLILAIEKTLFKSSQVKLNSLMFF